MDRGGRGDDGVVRPLGSLSFFVTRGLVPRVHEGGHRQARRQRHDHAETGDPNGIRTRVTTLKGWCPRPLDEGD